VLAALGRGTMADVRLLNQGLEFVGNGIISGAELAGHLVKVGWQDWLRQTMREAPHEFHTPEPEKKPAPTEPIRDVLTVLHAGIGTGEDKSKRPAPPKPKPAMTHVTVERHGEPKRAPASYAVPEYTPEMEATYKARGFTFVGGPDIDLTKPEKSRFADIDLRSEEDKAAEAKQRAEEEASVKRRQYRPPAGTEPFVVEDTGRAGSRVSPRIERQDTGEDETPRPRARPQRRQRRDDSDDSYWDPNRIQRAFGGLIPARVSNGEYRMGASAVGRLGGGEPCGRGIGYRAAEPNGRATERT
jgi:hypothetical protein